MTHIKYMIQIEINYSGEPSDFIEDKYNNAGLRKGVLANILTG